MSAGLRIREGIRLVLITGAPGTSKSTVAKLLFAAQSQEWRMLSLDDYFLVSQRPGPGLDAWGAFEAGAEARAGILKYIGDRRGKVIAEGIIQTDREVAAYAAAMGLVSGSPEMKFIRLECSRDLAAKRMLGRPIREPSQDNWSAEDYGRHHDWLSAKLRANGAYSVHAGSSDPVVIAEATAARINGA